MVSLDHQTPFEKPVAFVMLQVFQVAQSSVIVVSMTCVNSALVKTLTRRGVLRSRKISMVAELDDPITFGESIH